MHGEIFTGSRGIHLWLWRTIIQSFRVWIQVLGKRGKVYDEKEETAPL